MFDWIQRLMAEVHAVLEATPKSTSPARQRSQRRVGCFEGLENRSLLTTLPAGFQDEVVVGNLLEPTAMVVAPDGRIFVAEKPTGVRVIENGQLLPTPMITLPVEAQYERGINSLVLDPQFATNGYLYIYYTRLQGTQWANRLSRFTVSASNPNLADPASERVLIDGITTFTVGAHLGGVLQFGADGMLYLGIGDTLNTALVQDLTVLPGKILRIDPANYPNLIPVDNPFVGTLGARGEIWASGFRNPFTGAMQPGTSRLLVNDVGATAFEEVNDILPGGNYGWPLAEGISTDPQFSNPLHVYAHGDEGAAIAGGVFYTGSTFPPVYSGKYLFGDYVNGFIRRLDSQTGQTANFASDLVTPVDLDNAPDGSLYWLSRGDGASGGSLHRIRFATGNRTPEAIAAANVVAGLAPLTVTFDASGSSDPDEDALTYAWDFGDGETGTGIAPTHTYATNGTYSVVLTASDGNALGSSQPLTITVGNVPPTGEIVTPLVGDNYAAGNTISFSGTAEDDEDGPLDASEFEWKIVFHHGTHTHPFINSITGVTSGQFTIPLTGETEADQWYRIQLTVTDSIGLKHTSFRDVHPRTANFTLTTNPAGGTVLLDGQPVATPATITGVVGMTRTIGAGPPQVLSGRMYQFSSWSDGGVSSHTIATPATATTFQANLSAVALAATYTSNAPTQVVGGQSVSYQITVTNVGSQSWSRFGTNKVQLGAYFDAASDVPGTWTVEPPRFALTTNVSPGQSFTFNVTVTAPTGPGVHVLRNRLVKEGVSWFDSLNKANVTVVFLKAGYSGAPPAAWGSGAARQYSITVTNTGSFTWKASGTDRVRLAAYFGTASDAPPATSAAAFFTLPYDVAPGQSATVSVNVAAPTTAGSYTLRHRMVHESGAWFPDMLKTPAAVELLSAQFSFSPPTAWRVGRTNTYYATITNNGSHTWKATGPNAVQLGIYFGGSSDAVGAWTEEPQRFALTQDVTPGQTVTLSVTVRAPQSTGSFTLRHRMVHQSLGWFSTMKKTSVRVRA